MLAHASGIDASVNSDMVNGERVVETTANDMVNS